MHRVSPSSCRRKGDLRIAVIWEETKKDLHGPSGRWNRECGEKLPGREGWQRGGVGAKGGAGCLMEETALEPGHKGLPSVMAFGKCRHQEELWREGGPKA